MYKFYLDDVQVEKLRNWQSEQNARIIERQKEKIKEDHPDFKKLSHHWKTGIPYGGAIGGALTYMFTPTTLGDVVKVRHSNGEELDLTDYDWW